jgi:hypothetical protein
MWRKIVWGVTLVALVALAAACQGKEELVTPSTAAAAADSATVTPVTDKTVDDVLAAYAAARGGKDKLAAVQTVRFTGIMAGGRIKGLPVTIEKKRPNEYRRVVEDPEGRQLSGFDGHAGWQQHGQDPVRPLPPPAVARVRRTADVDGPLVDGKAKGYQAKLLGKQKAAAGEVYVVELTFENGDSATYYLDTKSGLLIRSRENVPTSEGLQAAVMTYQDYRSVDGVTWPFKQVVVTPSNGMTQSFTWDKIEVNVPLDDALFSSPKT